MKHTKYLFPLIFCLFLTACGPKPAEEPPDASVSEPPAASEPGPDVSVPDISEPDTSVPESPASLTQEDKAAAYDAAMDYYADTVFEVHSLTQIDALEGEIMFQVSCSKDGEKLPDRTISLERQNGVWTVINEGY